MLCEANASRLWTQDSQEPEWLSKKLTQAHVQPFLLFLTEVFEMRNDKVFHCDGHKSINAGWHCAEKKNKKKNATLDKSDRFVQSAD